MWAQNGYAPAVGVAAAAPRELQYDTTQQTDGDASVSVSMVGVGGFSMACGVGNAHERAVADGFDLETRRVLEQAYRALDDAREELRQRTAYAVHPRGAGDTVASPPAAGDSDAVAEVAAKFLLQRDPSLAHPSCIYVELNLLNLLLFARDEVADVYATPAGTPDQALLTMMLHVCCANAHPNKRVLMDEAVKGRVEWCPIIAYHFTSIAQEAIAMEFHAGAVLRRGFATWRRRCVGIDGTRRQLRPGGSGSGLGAGPRGRSTPGATRGVPPSVSTRHTRVAGGPAAAPAPSPHRQGQHLGRSGSSNASAGGTSIPRGRSRSQSTDTAASRGGPRGASMPQPTPRVQLHTARGRPAPTIVAGGGGGGSRRGGGSVRQASGRTAASATPLAAARRRSGETSVSVDHSVRGDRAAAAATAAAAVQVQAQAQAQDPETPAHLVDADSTPPHRDTSPGLARVREALGLPQAPRAASTSMSDAPTHTTATTTDALERPQEVSLMLLRDLKELLGAHMRGRGGVEAPSQRSISPPPTTTTAGVEDSLRTQSVGRSRSVASASDLLERVSQWSRSCPPRDPADAHSPLGSGPHDDHNHDPAAVTISSDTGVSASPTFMDKLLPRRPRRGDGGGVASPFTEQSAPSEYSPVMLDAVIPSALRAAAAAAATSPMTPHTACGGRGAGEAVHTAVPSSGTLGTRAPFSDEFPGTGGTTAGLGGAADRLSGRAAVQALPHPSYPDLDNLGTPVRAHSGAGDTTSPVAHARSGGVGACASTPQLPSASAMPPASTTAHMTTTPPEGHGTAAVAHRGSAVPLTALPSADALPSHLDTSPPALVVPFDAVGGAAGGSMRRGYVGSAAAAGVVAAVSPGSAVAFTPSRHGAAAAAASQRRERPTPSPSGGLRPRAAPEEAPRAGGEQTPGRVVPPAPQPRRPSTPSAVPSAPPSLPRVTVTTATAALPVTGVRGTSASPQRGAGERGVPAAAAQQPLRFVSMSPTKPVAAAAAPPPPSPPRDHSVVGGAPSSTDGVPPTHVFNGVHAAAVRSVASTSPGASPAKAASIHAPAGREVLQRGDVVGGVAGPGREARGASSLQGPSAASPNHSEIHTELRARVHAHAQMRRAREGAVTRGSDGCHDREARGYAHGHDVGGAGGPPLTPRTTRQLLMVNEATTARVERRATEPIVADEAGNVHGIQDRSGLSVHSRVASTESAPHPGDRRAPQAGMLGVVADASGLAFSGDLSDRDTNAPLPLPERYASTAMSLHQHWGEGAGGGDDHSVVDPVVPPSGPIGMSQSRYTPPGHPPQRSAYPYNRLFGSASGVGARGRGVSAASGAAVARPAAVDSEGDTPHTPQMVASSRALASSAAGSGMAAGTASTLARAAAPRSGSQRSRVGTTARTSGFLQQSGAVSAHGAPMPPALREDGSLLCVEDLGGIAHQSRARLTRTGSSLLNTARDRDVVSRAATSTVSTSTRLGNSAHGTLDILAVDSRSRIDRAYEDTTARVAARLRRICFATWRDAQAARLAAHAAAVAGVRLATQRRVWGVWQGALAARWREAARREHWIVARAFRTWRREYSARRVSETLGARVTRVVFESWRGALADARGHAKVLAAASRTRARRVQQHAWRAWRAYTLQARVAARERRAVFTRWCMAARAGGFTRTLAQRQLARTLRTWRLEATAGAVRRACLRRWADAWRARTHDCTRLRHRLWTQWREEFQRHTTAAVADRRRRLRSALYTWADAAQQRADEAASVRRIQHARTTRLLTTAFAKWSHRFHERAALYAFADARAARDRARYFEAWRLRRGAAAAERAAEEAFVAARDHTATADAFDLWRAAAARRVAARTVVRRRLARSTAAVFTRWLSATRARGADAQRVAALHEQWARRRAGRVWWQWRQATWEAQASAAARMCHRVHLVRGCLRGWRAAARQSRRDREMVVRFQRQHGVAVRARAFWMWRDETWLRESMRLAGLHHRVRRQRAVLRAWRALCATPPHLKRAEEAVRLRRGFRTWRRRYQQQLLVASHARALQSSVVRAALLQWQIAMRERWAVATAKQQLARHTARVLRAVLRAWRAATRRLAELEQRVATSTRRFNLQRRVFATWARAKYEQAHLQHMIQAGETLARRLLFSRYFLHWRRRYEVRARVPAWEKRLAAQRRRPRFWGTRAREYLDDDSDDDATA